MKEKKEPVIVLQPLWTRIVLLFVLGYEGLGGLVGGSLLVAKPNGELMELPVDLMRGAFADFLIPGIILFSMGIVSLSAFFQILLKKPADWLWSCIVLCGWYIWFVVEIIILHELHWLHLMWGIPVLLGIIVVIPLVAGRNYTPVMFKILLVCGILSSVWYTFMNLFVPLHYPGYSSLSLTVSELSAVGSPTRILWVLLGTLYPLLYAAFGWGILYVSGNNKKLKILSALIIGYSILNLYWPPMHTREAIAAGAKSLTDTLHIVWTIATVFLFICMMGFGAAASGKKFRIYTIISIGLLLLFGILTGMGSSNLEANLPTPMMGLWERINQYIFFIWVILLSLQLIKKNAA
ncbi:MAG TPA: DUF998 domain-containing protein [Flavobacterium sp.]|uniref:DUF998 domain-containing protein n=1 Tax=Flavobacterium sp. TaxID=239 RepID=UPI002CB11C2E|nr:DUF998 domain-containing protein [Flavobacterium sp.]HSD15338.1 DUF998 domain-containing protein [Flavobacterium sp.]